MGQDRVQTDSGMALSTAHQQGFYKIGHIAKSSGISAKMIRYYESIGLLPPSKRTQANYRIYSEQDLQMLCFIKKSRTLGFSLEQIKILLDLWLDPGRASAHVKTLVLSHVEELDQRIAEMQNMRDTLFHLAKECRGDFSSDCPILTELSHWN